MRGRSLIKEKLQDFHGSALLHLSVSPSDDRLQYRILNVTYILLVYGIPRDRHILCLIYANNRLTSVCIFYSTYCQAQNCNGGFKRNVFKCHKTDELPYLCCALSEGS